MTKRQWHSGPPPSVGWWPASMWGLHITIRWWNGKHWSWPVDPSCNAKMAALYAKEPSREQDKIKWTERWWE